MNNRYLKWTFAALLVAFVAAPVIRVQANDEEDFQISTSAPPATRTGGASRGGSDSAKSPTLSILAPSSTVGLTTMEQPVIAWSLSADTDLSIEVGINSPKHLENPVLLHTIKGPKKAGIHLLDLSKVEQEGKPVKFEPGVNYEIAVVLLAKPAGSSENASATCLIQRVDPKDAPKVESAGKDAAKLASAYGKAGIWIDYINALNSAIAASPKDEALLDRRAKALKAQGLIWNADGTVSEQKSDAKKPAAK